MRKQNSFQKFLFTDLHVRGEWVRLENAFDAAMGGRDYHPVVKDLLAQTAAASVLLTGTLKFEGLLSIHARGNGPVNLLMAESNEKKQFRCLANYDDSALQALVNQSNEGLNQAGGETPELSTLLGQAQLAITLDPAKGQRYQGIVPLERASMASCLAHYFELSEQLDTHFAFHFHDNQVHALMLQKLPEYQDGDDADAWNRLLQMANTIQAEEWLQESSETLTTRLFHEESVSLYPEEYVEFKCSCSRERSLTSIEALGAEEALGILESEAVISVDCQFCSEHYEFNRDDIQQLFKLGARH